MLYVRVEHARASGTIDQAPRKKDIMELQLEYDPPSRAPHHPIRAPPAAHRVTVTQISVMCVIAYAWTVVRSAHCGACCAEAR